MYHLKTVVFVCFLLVSCSDVSQSNTFPLEKPQTINFKSSVDQLISNPIKNAYFGDLHVHTSNSFDAYTFGTLSTPEIAYNYAQGEAILHPSGYFIQLTTPLDFYAVTDHGVFLGILPESANTDSIFSKYEITKPLHNLNESVSGSIFEILKRNGLFRKFAQSLADGIDDGTIDTDLVSNIQNSVWNKTIQAADHAYVPGKFTTFAAYEYTSSEELYDNYLHRNVIFKDTKNLPYKIFTRTDSMNPEDLWAWMNNLRAEGVDSLAIPHNSNISGGNAFSLNDFNGGSINNTYSINRMINEPLVEITQAKGTSETHPLLSLNDEWANFEVETGLIESNDINKLKGGFVRDAYLRGLKIESKGIINPYKFGLVAASDTHVGGGSYDEQAFFSKIGVLDGTPELRGSVPFNKVIGYTVSKIRPNFFSNVDNKYYFSASDRLIHFGASGLTGVWAEENTREAIYDAFRRKETFATSGPRIKIRFFIGDKLGSIDINNENLISYAYSNAITMGGDYDSSNSSNPDFLVWAFADPLGNPLQRIQIIKGWIEEGFHQEQVFDIACSDGLQVDSVTNRCPDNNAKVNLNDCSTSPNTGDMELKVLWNDPEFNAAQNAFYYVRVLENPSCRWSTWDAIRVGKTPRSDIPPVIQERAWSSPIWVK